MSQLYKECPICGSKTFFIRIKDKGMQFFNVTSENLVKPTSTSKEITPFSADASFSCTQCSWEGNLNDLK